jgi:hypothetical protein
MRFIGAGAALGIVDNLRRSLARLDLRAHLLQARSKRFDLLLPGGIVRVEFRDELLASPLLSVLLFGLLRMRVTN